MKIGRVIGVVVAVVVMLLIVNGGRPSPTRGNPTPIDATSGYAVTTPIRDASVIPADDGVLQGVIPMVDFECNGVVYMTKKDTQDGFDRSVTLAFGRLAEPPVFQHLVDDGATNTTFDDGFVLDTGYFRSHVAAFYVRPATVNVKKAIHSLDVGDHVRLKGQLVHLKTNRGTLETSLDPDQFKCKYAYITQVATEDSVYE